MADIATKRCFKCHQDVPLTEFYKHPQMPDGTLNKCKECTKADVSKNYRRRRDYYSAYEQQREQDPARKARKREYQRNHRARNPQKFIARTAVSNAVRDGRLIKPDHCTCCGRAGRVQAHHTDYSRPLDVLWLCFVCHREYGHNQTVTNKAYQQ